MKKTLSTLLALALGIATAPAPIPNANQGLVNTGFFNSTTAAEARAALGVGDSASVAAISNRIWIVNQPGLANGSGASPATPRNATNAVEFWEAMDRGQLSNDTRYILLSANFVASNACFLGTNTVVEGLATRINYLTNTAEVVDSGKFAAFLSRGYHSPGAAVEGLTLALEGYRNSAHTNAMNGVTLWGNGTETIDDVHVFDPKGNQISGSEGFTLALLPADNPALTPILYSPSITRSSVTFTNGTAEQSYVTAISVGGRRATNLVAAQGWAVIDNCTVIGPGAGVGWSMGYGVAGRGTVRNSAAIGLNRGIYHELQSGGNPTGDNGNVVYSGNLLDRVRIGVEIWGYTTNRGFRITGNTITNFTEYGVRIAPADASETPGNMVGVIYDVSVDNNTFTHSGANPHWNVFLRNVGGASAVRFNTMHSTSNFLGTGTLTNLAGEFDYRYIEALGNLRTNGGVAITNQVIGPLTTTGSDARMISSVGEFNTVVFDGVGYEFWWRGSPFSGLYNYNSNTYGLHQRAFSNFVVTAGIGTGRGTNFSYAALAVQTNDGYALRFLDAANNPTNNGIFHAPLASGGSDVVVGSIVGGVICNGTDNSGHFRIALGRRYYGSITDNNAYFYEKGNGWTFGSGGADRMELDQTGNLVIIRSNRIGGTLTVTNGITHPVQVVPTNTTTLVINCTTNGQEFTLAQSANLILGFTNRTAGQARDFTVALTPAGSDFTVTFAEANRWPEGGAPAGAITVTNGTVRRFAIRVNGTATNDTHIATTVFK